VQEIRDALEEILRLADDPSWSHVARMLKMKGLASKALSDLNDAPLKAAPRPVGRPRKEDGAKSRDKVQDEDTPTPPEAS
jgi:hypothetical protein